MTQSVFDIVVACLQRQGWTADAGVAVATKMYPTAVGPKQALAYLPSFRSESDSVWLTGDYQSEGRNCLSSTLVEICRTDEQPALAAKVLLFARAVDAAVADTYAYRLACANA